MSFWSKALDRSIVFSFDKTGYKRHAKDFLATETEGLLTDKTFLITGCNSGIGFACARQLLQRDARVIMVCRSEERGRSARTQLIAETHNSKVELRLADMADLDQINSMANGFSEPLDGLIHNAGNLIHEKITASCGVEYITALHVVGPYLLSMRLKANLTESGSQNAARVVFVSSGGMYTQRLNCDQLFDPSGPYDGVRHYAHTKRGQVVLAKALHQRWSDAGLSVHAMHPGWVDTPAVRRAIPTFAKLTSPILRNPDQGADTLSWLAGGPRLKIDEDFGFWFDRMRAPLHLKKSTASPEDDGTLLLDRLSDMINRGAAC
ncbi:MAG: SDR family NAD(P)-dependent oxidoreductase [Myxococcota bacterium]|nr:SDR family NAD(P)-dependent oxidoreductase [Myxococcota bacterium]